MKMTIYLPDDLETEVKKQEDLNVSAICQQALREELERRNRQERSMEAMEPLRVTLWGAGEQPYEAEFDGRWLVFPNDEAVYNGRCWGVALTSKGNIVVWSHDVGENFAPTLKTFGSLPEAEESVPEPILAVAAGAMGEDYVVKLDI